uniref:Uncharacterized protein n=1 Tax=Anguilla anguilla TaxID=7936 RepID=A0A0E9VC75_ANGAN
MYTGREIH